MFHPEYGTAPRVYYRNVPGRFVAGTVYDPASKRVITGAKCTLTGAGNTFTTTTDGFGDFWFEKLSEGVYSLNIEDKHYETKEIGDINTEKDVNLGDIPLRNIV